MRGESAGREKYEIEQAVARYTIHGVRIKVANSALPVAQTSQAKFPICVGALRRLTCSRRRTAVEAPTMKTRTAVTLSIVALALASSCTSRQTGKLGNLVFSYVADDEVTDFNKPIAIGARLDVNVRQKGNNKLVTITGCDTDDAAVLQVTGFEPSFFTLEAGEVGTTEVTVTAQLANGTEVEDKVDMRAAKPEALRLYHYCTKSADAYYLTNQKVYVPFEMELKDGEAVIGYGYHPVDVVPDGALTVHSDGKNQQHLWLQTPSTPQTVSLNSQIDDTSLVLSVVDERTIDGARYEGLKTVLANTKTPVLIRPTIGGKPVCQANTELVASSTTPEICAAKVLTDARKGADHTSSWGWIEIDAIALGKCSFAVNHLKANDRKGLTTTFSVDVAKVIKP